MLNCRLRLIHLVYIFIIPVLVQAQKQYGGVPIFYEEGRQNLKSNASHTIDLTNEVRNLRAKNLSETMPDNWLASPIVTSPTQKNRINGVKPIANSNSTAFLLHFEVGDVTESHIRLSDFEIPVGGRVFIIAEGESKIYGAYTEENNLSSGNFMVGPLKGNYTIEYDAPKPNPKAILPFKIEQVYVNVNQGAMELGFGASFECQINVNCEEGRGYTSEKNGVMRIQMVADEGIALCTGTLLNNTTRDRAPLVLSAYHCLFPPNSELTPQYDMWSFDFSYEGFSCADPDDEPQFVSARGCDFLASGLETDFLLLRITSDIPREANAYLNGWNRDPDHLPFRSSLIHHPAGDIKKITTDFDTLRVHSRATNWNNGTVTPARSHFINDFDDAVYQPGSSGGPLFDDQGFVIGQLHGGPLSDQFCSVGIGYSGRLSESWELGPDIDEQLKIWLDPQQSGETSIDGIEYNQSAQAVSFLGRVVTADGIAIPNVRISLTGDNQTSFLTGADGRFLIGNLLKAGSYQLHLDKNTAAGNGVSAIDLVLMMNHIIGIRSLDGVFQQFAGDINEDGIISSIDLVQVRNVIIGRTTEFPSSPSWRFEPNIIEMNGDNVGSSGIEVIFTGYKVGDINFNANPRN